MKRPLLRLLLWSQKYTKTDMRYAVGGGFWLVLPRIGAAIAVFAVMMTFSRFLPKDTYGAFQYVLATVGLLQIFALPHLGVALTRAVAQGYEEALRQVAITKFRWGLLAAAVTSGVGLWYFLQGNPVLGAAFLIGAASIPTLKTLALYKHFLLGKRDFARRAQYSLIADITSSALFVPVIFLTNNLLLILAAYFGFKIIIQGIFYWKIAGPASLETTPKENGKETISLGKHLSLMQAVQGRAEYVDKFLLWHFLDPVSVAVYTFAQLPLQRVRQFLPIGALALPKLSQKNIREIKGKLLIKFFKLFALSVPLAFLLAAVAPVVYRFLFPGYESSVVYFQALAFTIVLQPVALLSSSLLAEARKKELYIISLTSPIAKILLLLVLIPLFGIWGAVWTIIATRLLETTLTFYLFRRI